MVMQLGQAVNFLRNGKPKPLPGAPSGWNLKNLIRHVYLSDRTTKIADFSAESTQDNRMPSERSLHRWSRIDGGWPQLRDASAEQLEEPTEPHQSLYTDALAERFKERYYRLLGRDDLMCLKPDIALVCLRLQDLVSDLSGTGTLKQWEQIRSAYQVFDRAMDCHDMATANRAIEEIGKVLEQHGNDSSTWVELKDAIILHARLVESETKRLAHAGQFVTVEEAIKIGGERMDYLIEAIQSTCSTETQAAILDAYAAIEKRSAES